MLKVAVIGYGNIGKHAVQAVRATDGMELAGVVWRRAGEADPTELKDMKVVREIEDLGTVDAALLCVPSRKVESFATGILAKGINTVDSFDMHGDGIMNLRASLGEAAKAGGAVAIIAAGWDPGSDTVIRAILKAAAPRGITYTNFGPGMSMGHSVAAREAEGVANAMSLTVPLGSGLHRRMVYVELKEGASLTDVEKSIKRDPYFSHDETHVIPVGDVSAITDRGHGVSLIRKGAAGCEDNQLFNFEMKIHGPAVTAQIMASCALAASRQKPGAYTMIEFPLIDLLPGRPEQNIKELA